MDIADYMETVCIRMFNLGMELYPAMFPFQAALFKWIVDPSGCVYVGSLSNPLKGAMVTLYYLNVENGKWEVVITFFRLKDFFVKRFFRLNSKGCEMGKGG